MNTNTQTNGATRFTYQGQDYIITADGWRGYELHQNGAGPEYIDRTDHVMRMWRYWLDEQQYQEQEDDRGLW